MSAYLTRGERAALTPLPVAERRRVLSERFARECPNSEHSSHPGHVFRPGTPDLDCWCSFEQLYSFNYAGAVELSEIEAQIEREQNPPARIVQLLAPAVPLCVVPLARDEITARPERGSRPPVPVVTLALHSDGTISALTELDVVAGGVVAERYACSKVAAVASDPKPAALPSVAKLAPLKKAQAAK